MSLIVSIAALLISYLALIYTARPKVRVTLLNNEYFKPSQVVTLKFRVTMRSHLKKAAADMRVYVNFAPDIEPLVATFGAALEFSDSNVRTGKGASRCLVVPGIRVSREEPVPYEDFTIRAQMPSIPGSYAGWITCFAHDSQDDCGVSHFTVNVGTI